MPFIDFQAIRRAVPIQRALDSITWVPLTRYAGGRLRGRCPFHTSRNPKSRSFAVDLHLGKWYCHRCEMGGDVIDLWARLHTLDLVTAAVKLCDYACISVPYISGTEKRNGQHGAASR